MVDPRDAVIAEMPDAGMGDYEYPDDRVSLVQGSFEFFFHRGSPAQPFP